MTRGKKGASAAKGRAEAAEQALAVLKVAVAEERAEWVRERADLRNEVQRLRNRLVSDVSALAEKEIREARTASTGELKAAREDFQKRADECMKILESIPKSPLRPDLLATLADLLGANMAPALYQRSIAEGRLESNRRTRRAVQNVSAKKAATMAREADREADVWAGFGAKMRERDEWDAE